MKQNVRISLVKPVMWGNDYLDVIVIEDFNDSGIKEGVLVVQTDDTVSIFPLHNILATHTYAG